MNVIKDNVGVMLVTLVVVWAVRQTGSLYIDGY